MRKSRQLHLWIGLLTSFLILIEAITGLIMMEPQLVGMDKPSHGQQGIAMVNGHLGQGALANEDQVNLQRHGTGLYGFIKNLHAGRIGGTDVSILLEVLAVGLIILTITGMTMSIKRLKAQHRRRF